MSQLYAKERPAPVPLTEYQQRRKKRDAMEIVEAGVKRGYTAPMLQESLQKLDSLLPDIISLDKMRASDWVVVVADVNSVAAKLIQLRTFYPKLDLTKLIAKRPKVLLQTSQEIEENATKVVQLLSKAPNADPDAIIEAVPELADFHTLSQALANLKSWFPDKDPLASLAADPTFLTRTGQSDIDPDAEYGELSTKD